MSKARLIIAALFVEGQKPSEVAQRYDVHRAWVYKLKARYHAEGEAALEPRSKRPKSSPTATPADVVELIIRLRKELSEQGLDAGADTGPPRIFRTADCAVNYAASSEFR